MSQSNGNSRRLQMRLKIGAHCVECVKCAMIARQLYPGEEELPDIPAHKDCDCHWAREGQCMCCDRPFGSIPIDWSVIGIGVMTEAGPDRRSVCARCALGLAQMFHKANQQGVMAKLLAEIQGSAEKPSDIIIPTKRIILPGERHN